MPRFFLVIAMTLMSVTGGHAQDTSSVRPMFRDGALFACEVAFDNYLLDTAYLQAAPVHVAGSWAINHFPDRGMWGMLKVGITPLEGGDRIGPSDAYIILDYATNKADQSFGIDSDTPGFKLFGFDATKPQTLQAIIAPADQGIFTVAYTLNQGSVPTTFDVLLSDIDRQRYSDCLGALVAPPGGG